MHVLCCWSPDLPPAIIIVLSTTLGPSTGTEFSGAGPLSSTAGVSCLEHAINTIQRPRHQWNKSVIPAARDPMSCDHYLQYYLLIVRLTVVSTYRVSAHYILQLELVYTSDYAHPQDFRTDTRRSWLTVLVSKLLRRSAFSSAGSGGKYAMLTFCSHTTDSSSR
jgi:hypothetical protein